MTLDAAQITGFAIGIMIAFVSVLIGDWVVRIWIRAYRNKEKK